MVGKVLHSITMRPQLLLHAHGVRGCAVGRCLSAASIFEW
jgi:hypothetical protein